MFGGDRASFAMGKYTWRVLLALVAASVVLANVSAVAADDGLDDFVATYQCSLAGLIAKIHAHGQPEDQDRFIILSLPRPIAAYVQCLFGNKDREGLCEASSGWWNNSWEKPHFTPAQLAALSQLGFSTDGSHGNFKQRMHFPADGPEPYALATLLLRALHEGYGARKEMPIKVVAPFALRHGFLPRQRCVPIS
jgi:T3SS (YopN, CesT) and YbjN peptide-binding chaperone 3